MTLDLMLRCDECGKAQSVRPYIQWAPYSVLEVRGSSHDFYVDGARVYCAEHTPVDLREKQAASYRRMRASDET